MSTHTSQCLTTDVLVIGTGGAGLRAAIELHKRGQGVLVLGKRPRADAHTVLAAGGINAALATIDPEDSWVIHAADTLKEGHFLGHPQAVEILCREAPRLLARPMGGSRSATSARIATAAHAS
jgi:succinate dehydrogenase / fumarate reductase flavoprotein subunit